VGFLDGIGGGLQEPTDHLGLLGEMPFFAHEHEEDGLGDFVGGVGIAGLPQGGGKYEVDVLGGDACACVGGDGGVGGTARDGDGSGMRGSFASMMADRRAM